MTPKEKANELYSYYDNLLNKDFIFPIVGDNQLKECALIAVNVILDMLIGSFATIQYWEEVKKEIISL